MKQNKIFTALLILTALLFTGCFLQKEEKQSSIEKFDVRAFTSSYATMNIRGTNNNWGLTPMTLTNNNEWTVLGVTFGNTSTERFKFDATTNWATNFGDSNKDGIVEQNGGDIAVSAGQKYDIVFNDSTKKYTVTKVTATLTVSAISGKTQKGTPFTLPATGTYTNNGTSTSVPLTWTPAIDVTKLGDTVYTATSNGLTLTFTLTVWEPTLTVITTSSTINKGASFTLPTFGSYSANGTATTVSLTWTPALDVNKLGETIYSATVSGLTVTYKLTVVDFVPSTYTTMNLRGTPNNWTSSPMTLTAPYTWSIQGVKTGTSASERFKFDVKGDWTTNFGLNGVQSGTDIPLSASTTYDITFNDKTKQYSITKVIPQTLTIATTTGKVQKGTAFTLPTTGTYTNNGTSSEVALTWSPTVDTTKLGDTVYTGTANGLSVIFTLTVWEPTAPTLVISTTSSTINKGDTFTLPLGTYTKDGTSSQVALSWTPALDLTKIGATVYTGTANELSVTYTLTINDYIPSTYKTMNFRGTPNNWLSTPMTLTSAYTWTITNIKTGSATTERFKFDAYGDWKTSFGLNGGTQDIPLEANSTYTITFNDKTKAYTLSKLTIPTLTLATSTGSTKKGTAFTLPTTGTFTKDGVSSQVALSWTPATVDVSTMGTTTYTGTANGLSVTFTLTVTSEFSSTYPNMFFRGTSNNWAASKMTLVADYTWQIDQDFSGVSVGSNPDRFKFDTKGDWTVNFGDNDSNGIADLNATKDIYLNGVTGTYTIKFNDKTKAYNFTRKIIDTTKPIITLNGNANEFINLNSPYIDAGATAFDLVDGNISSKIITSGAVDTSTLGTYIIKYNVSDNASNPALEVIRTVTVQPKTYVSRDNITILQGFDGYFKNPPYESFAFSATQTQEDKEANLWEYIEKERAEDFYNDGITHIWLPPPGKAFMLASDTTLDTYNMGYAVYDHYDLGEFNQMGHVRTKYGTRQHLESAISELHKRKIKVITDIVMNHMLGAGIQTTQTYDMSYDNKGVSLGSGTTTEAYITFDFKNPISPTSTSTASYRGTTYSDFIWQPEHFTGMETYGNYYKFTDKKLGLLSIFGDISGTADYQQLRSDIILGADIDLTHPAVKAEMIKWTKWLVDTFDFDGFRVDAIKHMDIPFVTEWSTEMNNYMKNVKGKSQYLNFGENWDGWRERLNGYLTGLPTNTNVNFAQNGSSNYAGINKSMGLFDVPLHYDFQKIAGTNSETLDISELGKGTRGLLTLAPNEAITFVDNHDTYPSCDLSSYIPLHTKLQAYAYILLNEKGIPCVFYGDMYKGNMADASAPLVRDNKDFLYNGIKTLIEARNKYAYGAQTYYASTPGILGSMRAGDTTHTGSGLVYLIKKNGGTVDSLNITDASGKSWKLVAGSGSVSGTTFTLTNGANYAVWSPQ